MNDQIDNTPPKKAYPQNLVPFQKNGTIYVRNEHGKDVNIGIVEGTPVAAVAATGVLTLGANASNNNTVTIGTTVYTFKTALSTGPAVPYEVLIGTAATDSIDNLIAAINGDTGAGSTYGTGTVAHPDVTAAVGAGDTMGVTARIKGYAANAIATTKTLANGSFAHATLTGGVDGTASEKNAIMYDATNVYVATEETTKHDTAGWRKIAHSAL